MPSNQHIPTFVKQDNSPTVFLNEDLEQQFTERQINKIGRMWNKGDGIQKIADHFGRDPDEIFLALFHLARRDRLKRSFMSELRPIILKQIKNNQGELVI